MQSSVSRNFHIPMPDGSQTLSPPMLGITLANMLMSLILPETIFNGLHFFADCTCLSPCCLAWCAAKVAKKTTYMGSSHLKSSNLSPIETVYATSY